MALHINETAHFGAFSALNYAWINRYFEVESSDKKALDNPGAIVHQGGYIITLTDAAEVVGCCALLKHGEQRFELAKMAVAESHQGRGLARQLMQAAIGLARDNGALAIDLLTNSRLAAAVNLYRQSGFVALANAGHPDYARCDLVMRLDLVNKGGR